MKSKSIGMMIALAVLSTGPMLAAEHYIMAPWFQPTDWKQFVRSSAHWLTHRK